MKHRWTALFLGASLFVLLTSMQLPSGTPELKVDINPLTDLRIQLNAQNQTGKKLHLSVVMLENNALNHLSETEIYSENVAGDLSQVTRTLNLSNLESGNYLIRVQAGKKHFERYIDIRTKSVNVSEDSRIVLFK